MHTIIVIYIYLFIYIHRAISQKHPGKAGTTMTFTYCDCKYGCQSGPVRDCSQTMEECSLSRFSVGEIYEESIDLGLITLFSDKPV
jgi:hypothetical protein